MKLSYYMLAGVVLSVSLSGCQMAMPSGYTRSITVKKDATGKVIETLETETIIQHGRGRLLRFEYLTGFQPTSDLDDF